MDQPESPPRRARVLTSLAGWYARRQLPRFGQVLDLSGVHHQPLWTDAKPAITSERHFGHTLRLDLSDFFQRLAYFCGCYHELEILSTIRHAAAPGDQIVDGGANIGLVTLFAASIVGPGGRVDSFEPMPLAFENLRWHTETNALAHVHLHQAGLSDQPAHFELRLPGFDNLCAATFSDIPERYGDHVQSLGLVSVLRGDDVIPNTGAPLLIKLDIEGFELRALRGLELTLRGRLPALILEINPEMLGMNAATPEDVYDLLHALGYTPFAPDRGGFCTAHRLLLHRIERHQITLARDLLFVHPQSPHWERLRRLMREPGRYAEALTAR